MVSLSPGHCPDSGDTGPGSQNPTVLCSAAAQELRATGHPDGDFEIFFKGRPGKGGRRRATRPVPSDKNLDRGLTISRSQLCYTRNPDPESGVPPQSNSPPATVPGEGASPPHRARQRAGVVGGGDSGRSRGPSVRRLAQPRFAPQPDRPSP
ncbi:hypothetical protein SKAU_G00093880 [Synaphobranchus kaupii]|uniref:Uncharacterized protein n=1 Tax=Synaphobranchus kaupii TaxID=118154 RepID=A0A9Q1J4L2_SYNKA|nr:hypothetical protein SKAU_G00093880 [Synaphobranchus kaupii]